MKNENPWIEICPGIKRQTAASGKTMYQMIAHLEAGSKMPEHQHPQEQIVHILEGRMKLIVSARRATNTSRSTKQIVRDDRWIEQSSPRRPRC